MPEFTLKFVAHSSDTPTTYSIDPFTGVNVTHSGSHSEWTTLDVTIKNQPFSPYSDPSSATGMINFFYNIRVKGHFSDNWIELYRASDGYPIQDSGSKYTVVSYSVGTTGGDLDSGQRMVHVYGQVDFQVEAMVGWVSRVLNPNAAGQLDMYPWRFTGEVSGWSSTQTLIFDGSAPTETASSSPSPTSPAIVSPTPQNTTISPSPSSSPLPSSQIPDSTSDSSIQSNTQNTIVLGLDWVQLVVLIALIITVIVLAVAVAYLYHKSAKAKVETAAGASR